MAEPVTEPGNRNLVATWMANGFGIAAIVGVAFGWLSLLGPASGTGDGLGAVVYGLLGYVAGGVAACIAGMMRSSAASERRPKVGGALLGWVVPLVVAVALLELSSPGYLF